MKTIAVAAGLAVAFASSGMLAPASAQRQVSLPAAPGFVIGNQQRAGRQILVELVPAGQSVNRYTKMISLQTFPNVAATVPPGSFMNAFTRRYLAACPRAQAQMMSLGGGKSGMRIQCPLHPNTGKPETVFARAFPVGRDMAMTHVTLKYVAMPGDAAWARDYVARVG
jgi:hypothetical protein